MTRRSPAQYDWSRARFDQRLLTKHFTPQASRTIKYVVIHHMTVPGSTTGRALDTCWDIWQTREASAHYGIDGTFVRQFVWDKDRAWATGSNDGNNHGISIEHANSSMGPTWEIGADTLASSVRLVANLHVIHRLGRPTKNGTLRKHSSFSATACPGPYMDRIWDRYVRDVQAEYDRITGTPSTGSSTPKPRPTDGDLSMSDIKKIMDRLDELEDRLPQRIADYRVPLTDADRTALGGSKLKSISLAGLLKTGVRLQARQTTADALLREVRE